MNTGTVYANFYSLADEMEITEALSKKLIAKNSIATMQQDDYNRKYDALIQKHHAVDEKVE